MKDLVYLQFVYRSKAITPCMFIDVIEIRVLEDVVVLLIREGWVIFEEKLFGLRLDPRLVDDEIKPSSRQFGFHFDSDKNVTAVDVVTAYDELLDARLQSLKDLETRRQATTEPQVTPTKRIAAPKRKGKEKEPADNYNTLPLEEPVMKQKRGGGHIRERSGRTELQNKADLHSRVPVWKCSSRNESQDSCEGSGGQAAACPCRHRV